MKNNIARVEAHANVSISREFIMLRFTKIYDAPCLLLLLYIWKLVGNAKGMCYLFMQNSLDLYGRAT